MPDIRKMLEEQLKNLQDGDLYGIHGRTQYCPGHL